MFKNIIKKIESLPPLPQTIVDIGEFKKEDIKNVDDFIRIIEKDPLCVTNLLKVSNSSLFGFRSKIETVSRAVNLLGVNFIMYIVLNESITNILKTDLSPYGIDCDDFMKASHMSLNLVNLWLLNIDKKSKDEILLGALVQELGKFILSELIINKEINDKFKKRVEVSNNVAEVEREFLNITTSKVTAEIFKYWNLSEKLIKMIEYVDDIEFCEEDYKRKAQILDVVKTICNVCNTFCEENIEMGLQKAREYNLDVEALNSAINVLKGRFNGGE